MLVLSRKPDESIVIPGARVTVTVLSARGNTVRLGIVAPEGVAVHREEIWQRVEELTLPLERTRTE